MNAMLKFERELDDLRQRLLRHPLSKHFSASNVSLQGHSVGSVVNVGFAIPGDTFARLFMLLDDSTCNVQVQASTSRDGAPPGLYIRSNHGFIERAQYNRVGVYTLVPNADGSGPEKGVFVDHIFFDESAPRGLGTTGFGLLAIAAYEVGYDEVTLLAGGAARGGWSPPDMIGYKVWPKFGFDAPMVPGETRGFPHLKACRYVSEVRAVDLHWWENTGGEGRVMRFDLSPDSASWQTLIQYVRTHGGFP